MLVGTVGRWWCLVKKEGVYFEFEAWECERGRRLEKKLFCNIHSDSCTVSIFRNRIVENGKETVEEWEDNILKRRLVDGTLQLTN